MNSYGCPVSVSWQKNYFQIPNFSVNQNQATGLLLYLCFSRSIDLIFNRNTQPGYDVGQIIKKITGTVATSDLLHVHDNGRDWVRASAGFHDQLDSRFVSYRGLSSYAAESYALPASDFKVIHNGVDTRRTLSNSQAEAASLKVRIEYGIPADSAVIGFIGRMADQKDPLRWVEAAAVMSGDHPSLHFIMVGDGELRPQIEERIHQLELGNHIHLLGYRNDLDAIYPAITILLLTSRYEGLPMVVLEAMLQGVPVVSTNTGGTDECITEEIGELVPADASPEYIAAKVLVLLNRIKQTLQYGLNVEHGFKVTSASK